MSRRNDGKPVHNPPSSSPCSMHEVDPQYMGLTQGSHNTVSQSAGTLADLGDALLKGLPDAIIYADVAGSIGHWNDGAQRIFGFSAAEAVGQSLDIIIPQGLRSRHWEGYQRMMTTGQSRHAAHELLAVPALHKSGERLSIQFTVAPVRTADGELAGIIALLRDVTATFNELQRLRTALA